MAAESERVTALFSMYNDDDEEDDYNEPANPSPSPKSPVQPDDTTTSKTLIVDYAHDEMDHDGLRDNHIVSKSSISENIERPNSNPDNPIIIPNSNNELSEEIGVNCTDSLNNDDLLYSFLGPPVTSKCPQELQEKINKFIAFKRSGRSFNDDLRNRKNYRNPDFLQHAVGYQDIDQIGSCFKKDVFDPHGYDKCDFYDEIETDMKREMERKEQERKRSPKVDFISASQQPSPLGPILKTSSSSGLPQVQMDAAPRQKKSKWDKVEGDMKKPVVQENISHAPLSNTISIGSGYSGFAQQKRKEAEEKKANDIRSDKRS